MSIYLSEETQDLLFSCQRGVFAVTSLLHCLSLYCLLKQTPPKQTPVRMYLVYVQILVICSGVYVDVLFEPIPIFPAIAGYCVGLLCWAGVHPHTVLGFAFAILAAVGTTIVSCCFFRHQTIVQERSWFRFGKTAYRTAHLALPAVTCTGPIVYALVPFDDHNVLELLRASPYNITWIVSRGPFFMHDREPVIVVGVCLLNLILAVDTTICVLLFWHMFSVLSGETSRSPQTTKAIKYSLIVLFFQVSKWIGFVIQIAVPLSIIVVPAFILFTSMACECIPFAVSLPAYFVLTLHPFLHNVCLLSVTPPYRRFVLSLLRGCPRKISPSPNSTTVPR